MIQNQRDLIARNTPRSNSNPAGGRSERTIREPVAARFVRSPASCGIARIVRSRSWSPDRPCRLAGSVRSRIRQAPVAPPARALWTAQSVRRSDRFVLRRLIAAAAPRAASARARGNAMASGLGALDLGGFGFRHRDRKRWAGHFLADDTDRLRCGCRRCRPLQRTSALDADPFAGRQHWRRSRAAAAAAIKYRDAVLAPRKGERHTVLACRPTVAATDLFCEPLRTFSDRDFILLACQFKWGRRLPRFFASFFCLAVKRQRDRDRRCPCRGRSATCMSPPCSATRPFTIESPRPVPSWRRS